jgi:hypothetical protein
VVVEIVVMNQPAKMEAVPAENDEPGQQPKANAGSLLGFARAQTWFALVAAAVLLVTWLVLRVVGIEQGERLVALAWGACFFGVIQSRMAAYLLHRCGVGGERHLAGAILRPIFPLALFLALTILKSPLADTPLAIVLVVTYATMLLADTITTVYGMDDKQSISELHSERHVTLSSF